MSQKRVPAPSASLAAKAAAAPAPAKLELNIDITKATDRVVVPVGGVFGGLNSQNQLVAHFYVEYPDLPTSGKLRIDVNNSKLQQNTLEWRHDHVTREIVATVLIPSQLTTAFAAWFEAQAKAIAQAQTLHLDQ